MPLKRYLILLMLLCLSLSGKSQITSFLGGSVYPNLGKTRAANSSFSTGYGAGITYVFREYDEWFIKSGIGYLSRSSGLTDLPRYFEVPAGSELQRIEMRYTQEDIVIPLAIYYLPVRKKENAMLVMGGIDIMYGVRESYQSDTYGKVSFTGEDLDQQFKIGFTIGAGYQRKFTDILFLNLLPTVNFDFRSDKPFTTIGITLEMIYGLY